MQCVIVEKYLNRCKEHVNQEIQAEVQKFKATAEENIATHNDKLRLIVKTVTDPTQRGGLENYASWIFGAEYSEVDGFISDKKCTDAVECLEFLTNSVDAIRQAGIMQSGKEPISEMMNQACK